MISKITLINLDYIMPSFGGFSSVRFKDAQTKNQSGSQQGVYNIITSYEEIGYNHPFCKILRPESILDIPVNDNGLKKKKYVL